MEISYGAVPVSERPARRSAEKYIPCVIAVSFLVGGGLGALIPLALKVDAFVCLGIGLGCAVGFSAISALYVWRCCR